MLTARNISTFILVLVLLKGTKTALVQLTTNNIYSTYIELVDNHFDISNVTSFTFEVTVCNDGFVGLAEFYGDTTKNFYEILLDGYGEQHKFGVRDGASSALEADTNDPTMASCSGFKPYWVSWSGGVVALGAGDTPGVSGIVEWDDPDPHPVNYALISSGFGAVGQWKFYNKDGGWSPWTQLSRCQGEPTVERRVRYCNNPLPELGGNCTGAGEDIKPCSLYWTLLMPRAKMSTAILATASARSRTDCCSACLLHPGCRGVSYSTTTSSCIFADGKPTVGSLEQDDGWDTWIKN
ncbi:uncharacterized protein LOC124111642 [Haliotis rufescens]|uniref:uncharacterized protein LOC124111642 n=1 Tax=Haliotis rufescens TaxID=6454 RepID=UPI001EAFE4F1|nr:uncharacterized protein LOC124111642 [Haliotis rufescens]